MAELCRYTPLPIALDEELIGINDKALKSELIKSINPQYIILKPSLHGGINGGEEWIELAQTHNIGWWITSALESNVGLNAIAHWCAMLQEGKSMNVSFEEIGRLAVTFGHEGCVAGQVCKVSANGTVAPCAAGDKLCGIVEGVRGDYAAVQVAGFAEVPYSGSVGLGHVSLCADGSGGVKAGAGREYLVVSVDENAQTAIIML